MLHFFRKIRRELLANSQTIRYLKYGIGEIILVVIGILIAIQVDNWNEDRIAAENNKIFFQKVSDELVQNIERTDKIIDHYLLKDSLYFKVLNGKVDYQDYKDSPDLFRIVRWYDLANLMDDDFKELLERNSNLTELQDSLYSELKDLYGTRKKNVDVDDKNVNDLHQFINRKMMSELPSWSTFSYKDSVTDEMIQYALNNPFHLNHLSELYEMDRIHLNGMLWFRTKALDLYLELADMLKIKKDTALVKDLRDFDHVKGVYTDGGIKYEIQGTNKLKFRWVYDSVEYGYDIHPYSANHLILFDPINDELHNRALKIIELDKEGKVSALNWIMNGRGKEIKIKKIE